MITFKSLASLSQLDYVHPSLPLLEKLIERLIRELARIDRQWNPNEDGFFILVESKDIDAILENLYPGRTLLSIPYEGVHFEDGHYIATSLLNNQTAIMWIFPDQAWLSGELRQVLEDNLVP